MQNRIPFATLICVDNKKLLYGVLFLLHTAVSLFFPLSDYLCTRFLTITIPAASAASAALGAISEDQSILGKSLIFVGLAEGVALYGLIISFMILGQL